MQEKFRFIPDNKKELLDKWGIRLGKHALFADPDRQYEDIVPMPTNPHVFFTNKLHLESLRTKETVVLDDTMVMLAHGILSWKNREWQFIGTNKSVVQTVSAYDRVAKNMDWPLIDAVLVCRGVNTDQVERRLEEECNSKALFVWPSAPIIVSSVPQIYPGASGVNVAGVWEKGQGAKWIIAAALEWQGLDRWQQYSIDHKEERSRIQIPDWARNKTK